MKPCDNQIAMQLPGLTTEGQRRYEEAVAWKMEHRFDAWQEIMRMAREDTRTRGCASMKRIIEDVRYRRRVKVSNELTSALARLALEEDPTLKFKTQRSSVDGFTTAVLEHDKRKETK